MKIQDDFDSISLVSSVQTRQYWQKSQFIKWRQEIINILKWSQENINVCARAFTINNIRLLLVNIRVRPDMYCWLYLPVMS